MKKVYRIVREVSYKSYFILPEVEVSSYAAFYNSRGYCVLSYNVSDKVYNIEDKEAAFRWLSLRIIYIGKKKVKDEAFCTNLRNTLRGTCLIISK